MSKAKDEYYKCKNNAETEESSLSWVVEDYIKELEQQKKQLLILISRIPCTCSIEYSNRYLTSPYCPKCNWVDDNIIQEVI